MTHFLGHLKSCYMCNLRFRTEQSSLEYLNFTRRYFKYLIDGTFLLKKPPQLYQIICQFYKSWLCCLVVSIVYNINLLPILLLVILFVQWNMIRSPHKTLSDKWYLISIFIFTAPIVHMLRFFICLFLGKNSCHN